MEKTSSKRFALISSSRILSPFDSFFNDTPRSKVCKEFKPVDHWSTTKKWSRGIWSFDAFCTILVRERRGEWSNVYRPLGNLETLLQLIFYEGITRISSKGFNGDLTVDRPALTHTVSTRIEIRKRGKFNRRFSSWPMVLLVLGICGDARNRCLLIRVSMHFSCLQHVIKEVCYFTLKKREN